jgi:hypothetical protein
LQRELVAQQRAAIDAAFAAMAEDSTYHTEAGPSPMPLPRLIVRRCG